MTKQSKKTSCYPKIYEIVKLIPYGKVATYGQIADLAGLIGQPRVVGYALYRVVDSMEIPWHRVINTKGEVSRSALRDGNDDLQQSLLEGEGIVFNKRKLDLSVYRWQPSFTTINWLMEPPNEPPAV
ncbi:MGMT family protein [cf. Phormidesmis sp. LEGE 11477]|uniref:MGMT family protein n=1 Tax=cf. Phormidesmis sp. LEGE 11477 TaxID=1828680 RepID=UPI0018807435|nr:MGMT family protein [cf. Phormidesmis sp. LEGE 11477]MBE9061694.1 MGMT family protein [cf. Phormidesmis sp. LEGE 11477]